jgi:hypothetical protein
VRKMKKKLERERGTFIEPKDKRLERQCFLGLEEPVEECLLILRP